MLTYGNRKQFDDVTNNDAVNKLLCLFAEKLSLSIDRVNDEYGGICGHVSLFLPEIESSTDAV